MRALGSEDLRWLCYCFAPGCLFGNSCRSLLWKGEVSVSIPVSVAGAGSFFTLSRHQIFDSQSTFELLICFSTLSWGEVGGGDCHQGLSPRLFCDSWPFSPLSLSEVGIQTDRMRCCLGSSKEHSWEHLTLSCHGSVPCSDTQSSLAMPTNPEHCVKESFCPCWPQHIFSMIVI